MTLVNKSLILAFLLGLFLVQESYAIVRYDGADDQDYLDYGNQFDCTVGFVYHNDVGEGRWLNGSGVVIDDGHWVLTAAHCVMDKNSPSQPLGFSYSVITGSHPLGAERKFYGTDQWWVHPDYVELGSGPDLALLYFEEPIIGFTSETTPPITPATRFRGTDVLGSTISMVGFGHPGTPSTGWDMSIEARFRRGCKAPITYGLGEDIDVGTSFSAGGGFLNGKIAPGDSGGGWFIDVDGQQQLMGISNIIYNDFDYGPSWATRLSLFNDWIDGIQATTVIPEPSSVILLVAGGMTLLPFFRKRKK